MQTVNMTLPGMQNVTITCFVDTSEMEEAYTNRNDGQEMPEPLLKRNAFHAARKRLASQGATEVKLYPVG